MDGKYQILIDNAGSMDGWLLCKQTAGQFKILYPELGDYNKGTLIDELTRSVSGDQLVIPSSLSALSFEADQHSPLWLIGIQSEVMKTSLEEIIGRAKNEIGHLLVGDEHSLLCRGDANKDGVIAIKLITE